MELKAGSFWELKVDAKFRSILGKKGIQTLLIVCPSIDLVQQR